MGLIDPGFKKLRAHRAGFADGRQRPVGTVGGGAAAFEINWSMEAVFSIYCKAKDTFWVVFGLLGFMMAFWGGTWEMPAVLRLEAFYTWKNFVETSNLYLQQSSNILVWNPLPLESLPESLRPSLEPSDLKLQLFTMTFQFETSIGTALKTFSGIWNLFTWKLFLEPLAGLEAWFEPSRVWRCMPQTIAKTIQNPNWIQIFICWDLNVPKIFEKTVESSSCPMWKRAFRVHSKMRLLTDAARWPDVVAPAAKYPAPESVSGTPVEDAEKENVCTSPNIAHDLRHWVWNAFWIFEFLLCTLMVCCSTPSQPV